MTKITQVFDWPLIASHVDGGKGEMWPERGGGGRITRMVEIDLKLVFIC